MPISDGKRPIFTSSSLVGKDLFPIEMRTSSLKPTKLQIKAKAVSVEAKNRKEYYTSSEIKQ
ncbi:MAG: hypothetical protein LBV26_01510 [Bacteroidales bacterium]|nr:hypothetical protein [Bacteroidales bacterium]